MRHTSYGPQDCVQVAPAGPRRQEIINGEGERGEDGRDGEVGGEMGRVITIRDSQDSPWVSHPQSRDLGQRVSQDNPRVYHPKSWDLGQRESQDNL